MLGDIIKMFNYVALNESSIHTPSSLAIEAIHLSQNIIQMRSILAIAESFPKHLRNQERNCSFRRTNCVWHVSTILSINRQSMFRNIVNLTAQFGALFFCNTTWLRPATNADRRNEFKCEKANLRMRNLVFITYGSNLCETFLIWITWQVNCMCSMLNHKARQDWTQSQDNTICQQAINSVIRVHKLYKVQWSRAKFTATFSQQ